MKPAYEIVRADELQPDDVIVLDIHSHGVHVDRLIKGGGLVTVYPSKDVLSHKQPVLRVIPPERNPEVAFRAMRLMHFALYDASIHVPMAGDPQNFIRQAQAEIEREANDQA